MQLYKFDAIIRTTTIAMQQTGTKIVTIAAYDHRLILVPLLKSFMLVCVGFSVLFFLEVFHIVTFLPVHDFHVFGILFSFYRHAWKNWPTKMQKRSPRLQEKLQQNRTHTCIAVGLLFFSIVLQ